MAQRILVVGLTCVDIVNYVKAYPAEDSDSRVVRQVRLALTLIFSYRKLHSADIIETKIIKALGLLV